MSATSPRPAVKSCGVRAGGRFGSSKVATQAHRFGGISALTVEFTNLIRRGIVASDIADPRLWSRDDRGRHTRPHIEEEHVIELSHRLFFFSGANDSTRGH
jgi:hypothetical protein